MALQERGRLVDALTELPEAIWRQEGRYEFVAAYERALRIAPFMQGGVTPGGLDERERAIVAEIIAKHLNPKPKVEPAPIPRGRRRRQAAEVS